MELQKFKAEHREAGGKGAARSTRRDGNVPCVLYGHGAEPASLQLNLHDFEQMMNKHRGENAVLQLEVEGHSELSGPAMLKDVQHHPVRGTIIHLDFLRIRLDERIQTMVPLEITGHAKGVVEGGVLDQQLRELEVECLALEVPEQLTVDCTDWEIGFTLHVSDITAPEGVTIITEADRNVASVHAPRVAHEEAEGEEGEGEEGEEAEGEGDSEE